MPTVNEKAARWWVERFGIAEKREQFRAALLRHLPDADWQTYNDYDPQGLLLAAVREVVECAGVMFSGRGLFPDKTGLARVNGRLYAKDGYGAPSVEVES